MDAPLEYILEHCLHSFRAEKPEIVQSEAFILGPYIENRWCRIQILNCYSFAFIYIQKKIMNKERLK